MSMHYKRITAVAIMAVFAIGQTTCKKEKIDVPTVKVFEGAITISYTKASVSAEVTDQGGAEVKSRGFAYGESGGSMDTIYCGSGTGVFSADLNNLEPNTTYVYEAFAKNVGGFATSGKVTFTTKDNEKPTVKTNEVKDEDVTTTTASVSGNVTDDGGSQVTERGVCWSTNHNPTLNDSHLPAGGDLGEFTCNLTDLSANTKYFVRAYAKNSKGPAYGEEKDFTTKPLQTYTIDVSANSSNGGTVTGGGTFDEGQSCTVMARENTGYNFVIWTENNVQVSTDRDYTFQVTGDRNLVAIFTTQDYTITAIAEPEGSGTIEGIGGYNYGERCTLIAKAKPGFSFSKWTENGTQVSTNATYDFDVTGNRNLIAHFNTVDYTITAIADPVEGGRVTVSGNGGFNLGAPCTLTATPNPGYTFVNWTKGGTAVTDNPYTFNVTESAEYVGHFQSTAINLEVSANPNVIAQGSSSQLNAVATGGNGSYTYSWSPSTGLNNAHIQKPTATPTTTQTYTCTVTSGSQTANGTCIVTVVCPPTNLSATVQNNNQIRLNWTAANPATSYKVYRNNTLLASNVTSTTYTDSNLSAGTYKYRVSTVYQGIESPKSDEVEKTIYPSLNVTATASPSTISLGNSSTLNANATGGNGSYTYSWSPTTGLNNAHIKSPTATPTNTTTYTVTVSSNGQTASDNVTVYVVRPPTNLNRTVSGNSVYLTWTAPNTVSYYKVYRNGSQISGNVYQTSYTDSNLNSGTYSYYVTAVYNNVESSASNTVQATITSGGDQTFTVNGVSFTMKRVAGGTFWMGAQSTNSGGQNYDPDAYTGESPVHSVTVSTFYMGETEVTQALWQAVMGSNPSYFTGSTRPVESVSRNTIVNQFIPTLNALTGHTFRLPTEAEWEYAARGGNQSHGYKYAGSNTIDNVAWYYNNSGNQTHPVGTKSPNELGLYDMSGNVWEWCSDWYGNYSSGSQTNPQGPSSGSYHVVRGGGWDSFAIGCRVSHRGFDYTPPGDTYHNRGFRLVLSQ